jgi:hypothetical protein
MPGGEQGDLTFSNNPQITSGYAKRGPGAPARLSRLAVTMVDRPACAQQGLRPATRGGHYAVEQAVQAAQRLIAAADQLLPRLSFFGKWPDAGYLSVPPRRRASGQTRQGWC